MPAFIERMKARDPLGPPPRGVRRAVLDAEGKDAQLLRRVMLGYISYALGRVGEVVEHARDVDRIMGFGFNWAPPSVLVDAIGAARTIELLDREGLLVPPVLAEAAIAGMPLYAEPHEPGALLHRRCVTPPSGGATWRAYARRFRRALARSSSHGIRGLAGLCGLARSL